MGRHPAGVFRKHCFAVVDRRAQRAELLFVFRLHLVLIAAVVQIIGKPADFQTEFLKFLYGKIKQRPVVRLEEQMPSDTQQLQVQPQEIPVGQAPFRLFFLGPGIAEIQVQGFDFPRLEPVFHIRGVRVQDHQIVQPGFHRFLRRVIGNVKLGLDPDKRLFRVQGRHARDKAAFAAADFQTDFPAREPFLPAAFKPFYLFPVEKACFNHFGHGFFYPGFLS